MNASENRHTGSTNPYAVGSTEGQHKPGRSSEWPRRFRQVLARPSFLAAMIITLHFLVSGVCWLEFLRAYLAPDYSLNVDDVWYIVSHAWPIPMFTVLCSVLLSMAISAKVRRRFTFLTMGAVLQYEITIATTEYWDRGGRHRTYCIWWWYNDRVWFCPFS